MTRIDRIRTLLSEHSLDAILLNFLPNIRWACGFSGSNGYLFISKQKAVFLTDGRYTVQAQQEVKGAEVVIAASNLIKFAAERGLWDGVGRLGIEAEHMTLAGMEQLKQHFPGQNWQPVTAFLQRDVAVKSNEEIEAIGRAQAITDEVFEHLLTFIRPGMREHEVASEIVYQHLQQGASAMSFDPIVASGPHAALPHARPTDRVLQTGELVLMDFGCFLDGYASDMTRTIALGEVSEEAKKVYQVVLDAQEKALETARAGITTKVLDQSARQVIIQAGYGPAFSHSLGHGVGLQIHEWPRVASQTEDLLPQSCVITIEPGIYLEGQVGVRIEDLIVLQKEGHLNLTHSPKSLISL